MIGWTKHHKQRLFCVVFVFARAYVRPYILYKLSDRRSAGEASHLSESKLVSL